MGERHTQVAKGAERFAQAIWDRARRELGRETWLDWFILFIGGMGAFAISSLRAPPGYAIGWLAVVAAAMTFSRPRIVQRVLVTVLAGALYLVEIQAIQRDRASQDAQAQANLKTILDNNDLRFQTEMGKIEVVKDAADNAVSKLTGGNSYAFVEPIVDQARERIIPQVILIGDTPLMSVRLEMWHMVGPKPYVTSFDEISSLAPNSYRVSQLQIQAPTPGIDDRYVIFMTAINGEIAEDIRLRRDEKGRISVKYDVQRAKIIGSPNNPIVHTFGKLKARGWHSGD